MTTRCRVTRKIQYRSEYAAWRVVKQFNNAGLSIYKCERCNHWHFGNSREPWKVQARLNQLIEHFNGR
jgi:hypothetical protein